MPIDIRKTRESMLKLLKAQMLFLLFVTEHQQSYINYIKSLIIKIKYFYYLFTAKLLFLNKYNKNNNVDDLIVLFIYNYDTKCLKIMY